MGSGSKGELGLGSSMQVSSPTLIPLFPPRGTRIVHLSSGMGHSVAVLSNGEVYGWGAARKGQLGERLRREKTVWSPSKIEDVEDIGVIGGEATCGREFTVIARKLSLDSTMDFCILGSADNRWNILDAPKEIISGYRSIAASWHGVYVHLQNRTLVAWGRNDRGQLPPRDLPPPEQVAVGSEHALALLGDGTVVAFGWGEHGNCGPETDARGNVAGRYIRIPIDLENGSVVSGVGAGCATSWIIAKRRGGGTTNTDEILVKQA
ncbi:hypothetical protein ASPZODRAFT_132825 [Penicilliopsis zonata CBS 506.65]|uniref:Uncharacterized protein n=1 Tax=Penicilliopsis zonata CBS 506.65 TaxID=1073090 RepID=A0A1L9SHV8_9EURO|nr:hypothetical protein ASPZODRAFT_132825 [Penicilliopsis zonata CBS 506.65]OJJ46703.1 hypothetical protein ASPZODRAFT_132825 [Penicilliopsis zonata CBS 506.65]